METPKQRSIQIGERLLKNVGRAAIVGYWIAPFVTSLFHANRVRIDCGSSCYLEAAHHGLAVFGYVVLGGYITSWTQPPLREQESRQRLGLRPPFVGYREDVVHRSLFLGAAWAILAALTVLR